MPGFESDAPRIADYGAIGNLRTVALVGRDGSIDWCCFPHLDSPSVFASLLDRRRGGRFRVAPGGAGPGGQRYITGSNVLETTLDGPGGRLTLVDFMPLTGAIDGVGDRSHAPPEIHRILRAEGPGPVEVEVEWSPRFDYARSPTRIHLAAGGLVAEGGPGMRLALAGLPRDARVELVDDGGPTARVGFRVEGGRRVALVAHWGVGDPRADLNVSEAALRATIDTWRAWLQKESAADRGWAGPWAEFVTRSELVLKLLTHAESGALAAAATTSLPEWIGGARNWDYRYAWIRDASMVAQALVSVGHPRELEAFLRWAERSARGSGAPGHPRVLYGLRGGSSLAESELDHLDGYRGSRPVRIGNGAASQRQNDVHNDLLSGAYELARSTGHLPELNGFLSGVADRVVDDWREPDQGIWEMRIGPQHFVFSKIQMHEALARALQLATDFGMPGDVDRWRRTRREIRDDVLARGYDPALGAFVMSYERRALDAANLQIPLMEFLPPDDSRVRGTIDRTLEQLTVDGLVYRYKTPDGLPGPEGAFGLCTFWMVDALALSGRLDEAGAIFEGMIRRANHLGLYSEQIDPSSGEFLANFPQAFTHIGLINSVLYLAHAEGRETPVRDLIGTPGHRRRVGRSAD